MSGPCSEGYCGEASEGDNWTAVVADVTCSRCRRVIESLRTARPSHSLTAVEPGSEEGEPVDPLPARDEA